MISRVLVPGPSGLVNPGLRSAVLSPDGSMVAFSTPGPGGAKVWLLDAAGMRVAASIALGHGSNAVVFGPANPLPESATWYWSEVDRMRNQMSNEVSRWQRLRAAVSLRSLRAPRRQIVA